MSDTVLIYSYNSSGRRRRNDGLDVIGKPHNQKSQSIYISSGSEEANLGSYSRELTVQGSLCE